MSFKKTRLKNVYEDTRSGIYYVRIRRKGRDPLNVSLDTRNFKTAGQLADEIIRQYLGHAPKRKEQRIFRDEAEDFLKAYKARVKESTFIRVTSVIENYLMPYWASKALHEITPGEWDKYLVGEMAKSSRDLSNDKKAMSNILYYAHGEKRIDGVPRLTNPGKASDVGKEYSDEELQALLKNADNEDVRLAIVIAYKAGPRVGEIMALKWKDINFSDRYMRLNGKTGIRKAVFGELILKLLKERKKHSNSEWVFGQVRDPKKPLSTNDLDNKWQKVKRDACVHGRFHDLRHTFITRALKAGKSVLWVSKQVGSSVRTITKVYEHMDISDIAELGETVSVEGESEILGVATV